MLLHKQLSKSPTAARLLPFLIFSMVTACQSWFGEDARYWLYLARIITGAWLIWEMRSFVSELRLSFSWDAVVVGIGVLVMWIAIDGFYPKLTELLIKMGISNEPASPPHPWNPHAQFGHGSPLAWWFIVTRILGASLVVPVMEEVFFRSWLYRYIARPDFQSVPPGVFLVKPFLVTAVLFGSAHEEWLAGILCAFAYQGLVIRKKRLGDAIVAHGITNLLLGCWVVWKGAWNFW